MNKKILLLIIIIVTSCFEEDEPLLPYEGSFTLIKDNIEFIQSYFDFETNSVVGTLPVNQWAIGFGCKASDYVVITNSGSNWFIHNTNDTLLLEKNLPSETKIWEFDKQSAFPDSTALSNWLTFKDNDTVISKNIYLLGHYAGNLYDEKYCIQFLDVTSSYYTIYIKEFKADIGDTINIVKNPNKNFIYFSPKDRKIIDSEPSYQKYDIIFSPYYNIATQVGITAPYLVRGVFLNRYNTLAAIDSVTSFNSIHEITPGNYNFTSQKDIIGYNWKEVYIDQSSGTASYKIKENCSYIIQTQDGNCYKMRFINYQLNGENGFPSFEIDILRQQ